MAIVGWYFASRWSDSIFLQPLHPRKQDLAARIEDSAVWGQEMNNATYEVAGDLVKRII